MFFMKVCSFPSLIENFLNFIHFQYIEKHRYKAFPITNIMSIFFSSTGTYAATQMQLETFSHSIVLSECFPMDAITFVWGIPNARMFGSATHSICIYCVSITNMFHMFFLTKFLLRTFSIVSTIVLFSIWLDYYHSDFLSFVPHIHVVQTFLKLNRRFPDER